jgi:hypothetical protein
MAVSPLSPSARKYFYLIAADIIRELIGLHGAFRLFQPPASDASAEDQRSITFHQIQQKLEGQTYSTPNEFILDMRQLFYDAAVANPPESSLAKDAAALSLKLDRLAARLPRFISPPERSDALTRLFDLQKYRYLLRKTSHL